MLLKVAVRVVVWAAVLTAVVVITGLLAGRVGLLDRFFIYFPQQELVSTPADHGMPYEDVLIKTSDGVELHGWLAPVPISPEGSAWAVLWLHGNAGNIGDRADAMAAMARATGMTVLMVDYRGYGLSEGSPDETGLYRDAEAAFDYLAARPELSGAAIAVYGRSLGAAVAVELATRREVGALILEAPFTSIKALGRHAYPFVPTGLLVRARFDSLAKMPSVKSPVLVFHGTRDEIVPTDMGRQIHAATTGYKRLVLLDGGSHNDPHREQTAPYFTALREFLDEVSEEAGMGGAIEPPAETRRTLWRRPAGS